MQALVQWMQKHARVLTTPSTPEGQVAGPSLPEEVEELHNAEAAASEAKYWPVRSGSPPLLASQKALHRFSDFCQSFTYHRSSAAIFPPLQCFCVERLPILKACARAKVEWRTCVESVAVFWACVAQAGGTGVP